MRRKAEYGSVARAFLTPHNAIGTTEGMDKRIADLVNFEITEKSPEKVNAQLKIDKNLPSFEGHFPGNPILPAVSIIDISLYLLAQVHPEISHSNIQVKRSKFMAMVRPEQDVGIIAESSDGRNWQFVWRSADNQSKLAQIHLII